MNDKITEDLDWRDGINAFRLMIVKELDEINEKLEKLKQIKGEPQ